tara:strand:+ start:164 stop:442 length:279 start_codon:yes stop_codon:yes gene_type:complete
MPTASTAKKVTTPRKRRTRKATTTTKKVAPLNKTVAKTIVSETVKEQPKVQEVVNIKSLKDYPRDGLSLVILPLLYLEAFVKEILKSTGTVK